jgi:hypothetical protein
MLPKICKVLGLGFEFTYLFWFWDHMPHFFKKFKVQGLNLLTYFGLESTYHTSLKI